MNNQQTGGHNFKAGNKQQGGGAQKAGNQQRGALDAQVEEEGGAGVVDMGSQYTPPNEQQAGVAAAGGVFGVTEGAQDEDTEVTTNGGAKGKRGKDALTADTTN